MKKEILNLFLKIVELATIINEQKRAKLEVKLEVDNSLFIDVVLDGNENSTYSGYLEPTDSDVDIKIDVVIDYLLTLKL